MSVFEFLVSPTASVILTWQYHLSADLAVLSIPLLIISWGPSRAARSQPLGALAVDPHTALSAAVRGRVHALTMLLSIHPLAFVFASVGPKNQAVAHSRQSRVMKTIENTAAFYNAKQDLPVECAVTLFLVINVVALILATVWPFEDTLALHFVVAPHSAVLSTVGPVVNT